MAQFDQAMHEAVGLQRQGDHAAAAERYRRLLRSHPDQPDVLHLFGMTERDQGRPTEAIDWISRAIERRPNDAVMQANLGTTHLLIANHDAAIRHLERAVALAPGVPGFHSNLLMAHQYHPDVTPERLLEVHQAWDAAVAEPVRRMPAAGRPLANDRNPDRPLRVGFVSPDLGVHPVGIFLIGLLEAADSARLHTTAYALRSIDDPLAVRLRGAADAWVDASAMPIPALAERIRRDRVDVLVDLAGHTQSNRLTLFALRPAPVQATWMGYVGTTGLREMDLLIADPRQVRPEDESCFGERVVRLPSNYVIFDPPTDAPEVGPLPMAEAGHVTFGSFNNPAKLTPATLDAWFRIMNAVPKSRLMLKYKGFGETGRRKGLRQRAKAAGIDKDRLLLLDRSPRADHLGHYGRVDVALDTHPYSGGLTTLEAMWMGVPVVTMPGRTFASRHSLSHLVAAGQGDCVADDWDGYVARAVELASDRDALAARRAGLREAVAASSLCDGPAYAGAVETMFRESFAEWCDGGG